MKSPTLVSTLAVCLAIAHSSFAQGTAFTYQGRLNSGGAPASGRYDLAFTLYNTNTTGTAIAGPMTNSAVEVTNGLFTTTIDFGPGVFTGGSNWLELAASTNGANSFTTLAPRQQLTPVPYALFAGGANAAGLSGTIPASQLPGSVVTNGASGLTLNGVFVGNGAGMTNVGGTWSVNGSNLFYKAGFVGIGTASPASAMQVVGSMIGGGPANLVAPNLIASTIAGGGVPGYPNAIYGESSFIGAGNGNTINSNIDNSFIGAGYANNQSSTASFIGAGNFNSIQANSDFSAILGGSGNNATNSYATVLGGLYNVAGGSFSLASGVGARAWHQGATVFADSQFVYFDSTTDNEFSIRAQNGVRIQTDKGIHLSAGDEPIIVRDWDVFATNAPASKAGIGRYGLFMEPYTLTLGIAGDDMPGRNFQVAKYSTNGIPTTLLRVDQSGNVTATGGGVFSGLLARGGAPGPYGVNNNGYAFSGNGGDNDSGMYSTNDGVLQFYINNNEAMRIVNGRVGIGTATPASPLQVVGNIQLGGGGANYAASGQENLLIVRGIINPNGTIANGSGFTCTFNNVGNYTLKFSGFSDFPAVTFSGASCTATWNGISGSPGNINVGVSVVSYAGTPVNQYFSFIAVGPR